MHEVGQALLRLLGVEEGEARRELGEPRGGVPGWAADTAASASAIRGPPFSRAARSAASAASAGTAFSR
ncbi:MAG TPA: hypothetical protein VLI67_12030 [Vicinamibacteria bacterium]|nr:hypothetical protein [Vicinamibacteria bacterium]